MNASSKEVRTMGWRRSKLLALAVTAGAISVVIGASVSMAKPFFGTSGNDTIAGTDRHDYIAARGRRHR